MSLKKIFPAFIKQLERFDYDISSIDHVWRLPFPDKNGKWYQIHIVKYHKSYSVHHIDGNSCTLECTPEGDVRELETFRPSSFERGHGDPDRL